MSRRGVGTGGPGATIGGRAALRAAARIGVLAALLPGAGCVDAFLAPEPGNGPVEVFDLVWTEFDRHYASFATKGVDWDRAREVYRPRVGPSTTPAGLFQVLSEMLDELRDGHVALWTPMGGHTYRGWYEGRPENFHRETAFGHLRQGARWTASGRIAYGHLTDDVGYVHVPGFQPGSWAGEIDDALEALEGVRALVVDVRSNGGGTDQVSEPILARFMDRERTYRYFRYRNGPQHDDFTDLIEDRIGPAGRRFEGPVALLTNRRIYSTGDDFVLGMQVLDRVVTVGDSTGGGMGNPTHRELPNGWTFSVPRWQVFDARKRHLPDGVGLAPDVLVDISTEDAERGRDTILLTALQLLEERIGSS